MKLLKQRAQLGRQDGIRTMQTPSEFEMSDDAVIIRRDSNRLVIEPAYRGRLLELLAGWDALNAPFPDTDADLPALDEPWP